MLVKLCDNCKCNLECIASDFLNVHITASQVPYNLVDDGDFCSVICLSAYIQEMIKKGRHNIQTEHTNT